jgi:hypothetical protein
MNTIKKIISGVLGLLCIGFVSCTSESDFPEPTIKVLSSLVGSVGQLDEYGLPKAGADFQDVGVIVKRRTDQQALYDGLTDVEGEFEIEDVVVSEYIVEYAKDGFGTTSFVHTIPTSANGTYALPFNTIRENSLTVAQITSVVKVGEFSWKIDGTINIASTDANKRGVRLFFANGSPSASSVASLDIPATGTAFSTTVKGSDLFTKGLKAGSVSVVAYGRSIMNSASITAPPLNATASSVFSFNLAQ